MIPLVDTTLTINKPKLYLCKPNREIVSILSEAYNITNYQKLGGINEISFSIPTQVSIRHVLTDNPNITRLKDRYNIKYVYDDKTEWYVINQITSSMDSVDRKDIHCFSAGYELADKIIRSYTCTSLNATQVLTEVLDSTIWSIGSIDADFDILYRSMEISEATVLDVVNQISETFGALINWDTENREIDFLVLSENGVNRGLHFNYGNLLKSAESISVSDPMCTRLKVFGKNGMSIQEVSPLGQNYIEDFTFFKTTDYMSSGLISAMDAYDALVLSKAGDFTTYLATKAEYEITLTGLESDLVTLEAEMTIIEDNIDIAQANRESTADLLVQKNAKQAEIDAKQDEIDTATATLSSVSIAITVSTGCSSSGIIRFYIDDAIDGIPIPITVENGDTANDVADKINTAFNTFEINIAHATGTLIFSGIPIKNQTVKIGTEIYEFCISTPYGTHIGCALGSTFTTDNAVTVLASEINAHSALVTAVADTSTDTVIVTAIDAGTSGNSIKISETCTNASWDGTTLSISLDSDALYKSTVVDNVVTVLYYTTQDEADVPVTFNGYETGVTTSIVKSNFGINNIISKLQNDIAIENNFTADQITERNLYIIEKVWSDDNYIDADDLYTDALTKFENLKIPQLSATIDIVNFLECISEYRNWDKLNLGDYCSIYHEQLNMDIEAKIIEMQFDFENKTVKLTIANIKDLDDENSWLDKLNKAVSTSTNVDMSKYKWDGVTQVESDINNLIYNAWDASLTEIKSATEEKILIDGHGLTSFNSSDPNKAIRIMHSCLGITSDSFNSLDVAITPDGIIKEKIKFNIVSFE